MSLTPAMVIMMVLGGVCLAAASGFRVFVPLLVAGVAARMGVLPLHQGLDWLATDAALAVMGVACVVEIAGFYVPWVDHALDWLALPGAVVAGSLLATSQMADVNPMAAWLLGIVGGGGAAGAVHGLTMLTRGVSLISTGGFGNPIVATVETVAALVAAVVAIFVPVVALLVVGVGIYLVVRWRTKKRDSVRRVATAA